MKLKKRLAAFIICLSMILSSVPVFANQSIPDIVMEESNEVIETNLAPLEKKAWTLCIYLCGTNLESEWGAGTTNLTRLLDAKIPDNVTVLAMTGGTLGWDPYNDAENYAGAYMVPDANCSQIYQITDEAMKLVYSYPTNLNMGDSVSLCELLAFANTYAPSDHIMVDIWDHGGGPLAGAVWDEYTDNHMTLLEMANATKAYKNYTGKSIDIIGFDACLMNSLEIAVAFSSSCDYLLASEEVEPNNGWDYKFVEVFNKKANPTAYDIGKSAIDLYGPYNSAHPSQEDLTLALVDLSDIDKVAQAFDAMAADLNELMNDETKYSEFSRAVATVQPMYYAEDGLLDLYEFCDAVQDFSSNAKTIMNLLGKPSSNYVGKTLGDNPAIEYRVTGGDLKDALGMAFFYPVFGLYYSESYSLEYYINNFNNVATSEIYKEYVNALLTELNALEGFTGEIVVNFDPEINHYVASVEDPETLTPITSVYVELFQKIKDEKGNEHSYVLGDIDCDCDWDNNRFVENFDEYWYTCEGELVCASVAEYSGDGTYYYIPIFMEDGRKAELAIFADENYPTQGWLEEVYIYKTDEYPSCSIIPRTDTFSFRFAKCEQLSDDTTKWIPMETLHTVKSAYWELYDENLMLLNMGKEVFASNKNVTYELCFAFDDMKNETFLSEPCQYWIAETMEELEPTKIPDQVYTGKEVSPYIGLYYGTHQLSNLTHFMFDFTNNLEIGTANFSVTYDDQESLPGEIGGSFAIKPAEEVFKDLSIDSWCFEPINYLYMNAFSSPINGYVYPQKTLSRSELVDFLFNFAGEIDFLGKTGFKDVTSNAKAIAWARYNKLVLGDGNGNFFPNRQITREEFIKIIYNYSQYAGLVKGKINEKALANFEDNALVSDYATEAFAWAIGNGILIGRDGKLNPKDLITTAEAATVFYRLAEAK